MARKSFKHFVLYTKPEYKLNWHHELLMKYLQDFADGKIKKLLVFMPPQHGKSELTSRRLPAYLLGRNPKLRIIGCSYSGDLATSFNRDVQRIIDDEPYMDVFPETYLNKSNVKTSAKGSYLRNSDIFETVGHKGFYKSVGVGGSLTGTPADVGIIDDPVKDAVEAESPTYRARAWDWFTQVFLTRLHNDSQIIVTQTRWNEDDLSGRILKFMNDNEDWHVVSLPAIKYGETVPEDTRSEGEALWPEQHSLERLLEIRNANERAFNALYQQDPKPFEGGLIYKEWNLIDKITFDKAEGFEILGLDFGYSNPSALVRLKIDVKRKLLYVHEELYKTGLTPEKYVAELTEKGIKRNIQIIADSAREDLIDDLKKYFTIKPCKKGAGSVYYGIIKVQDFKMYITRESKNVISEIKYYRFIEDKDNNPTNEPLKVNDHAMDAIRYAVVHVVSDNTGLLGFG